MSEGKKRRVHTAEFKAKVGLEAVRGVKTVTEIAQEFGVHPVLVGQWKKEIQDRSRAREAAADAPMRAGKRAARDGVPPDRRGIPAGMRGRERPEAERAD